MREKRLETLPLNRVAITDDFWNRYIKLVRRVILPYQWRILNDQMKDAKSSHCIKNLKIAAGEITGEFEGVVFQDTDAAKWLEAAAYTLAVYPDGELEALADGVIELIGGAQREDGYLNTYFTIKAPDKRWTNLKEGHELYTAGHMIEAAVAYYQATGKTKFLDIVRTFADLICRVFGPEEGKCHGYPGHQEIELALVRLYQVTEEERYLTLAKHFIDVRGVGENYFLKEEEQPEYEPIFPEFTGYDTSYSQSHLPVREQMTAEGHAVRAVYMYCAMADLAWYCQDGDLLKACENLWDDMVRRRMYITGSIGSSGILERFTTDYDLPNDCNYSETCASIGLALFGRRMAAITKDAKYIDAVESALYNTLLAGVALDGRSFFYVNPLEVWPDNCMERTSREHIKAVRQKWFGVACCPTNIARTLASIGNYIYFTDDTTLYTNLYISSRVDTEIAGTKIRIEMDSDLLNSGRVCCKVRCSKGKSINAAFRVPAYAGRLCIQINGEEIQPGPIEKGYTVVADITDGMEIILVFDTPAQFIRANPEVRANTGRVAIVKGPVVYCLEEIDNGRNLSSLFIDTEQDLQTRFEPGLLGGVVTVELEGMRLDTSQWPADRLYSPGRMPLQKVQLKAVPYSGWGNRRPGEMAVWIKELRI